ncbi:MAG: RNA polymerase sigma factor [Acutalibacteraceae bacterium]
MCIPSTICTQGLIDDEALSLLIWIYCEDTSYQEAANRLGISLDSCKKRIQRAKQALKKLSKKINCSSVSLLDDIFK